MSIAVAGTAIPAPEHRADVIRAYEAASPRVHEEPGCELYALIASRVTRVRSLWCPASAGLVDPGPGAPCLIPSGTSAHLRAASSPAYPPSGAKFVILLSRGGTEDDGCQASVGEPSAAATLMRVGKIVTPRFTLASGTDSRWLVTRLGAAVDVASTARDKACQREHQVLCRSREAIEMRADPAECEVRSGQITITAALSAPNFRRYISRRALSALGAGAVAGGLYAAQASPMAVARLTRAAPSDTAGPRYALTLVAAPCLAAVVIGGWPAGGHRHNTHQLRGHA